MPRRGLTRTGCLVAFLLVGLFIAGALPCILRIQAAAGRMMVFNKFKEIATAVQQDLDRNGRLVRPIAGGSGEALLSWRVRLLPFLNQEVPADHFDHAAAWDAQPNVPTATAAPPLLLHWSQPKDSALTHTRAFDGVPLVIGGRASRSVSAVPGGATVKDIADGTSNTLLAAESAVPVVWTRPREMPVRPDGALPQLGGLMPGTVILLFADGSSRWYPPERLPPKFQRALIGIDDGQPTEVP